MQGPASTGVKAGAGAAAAATRGRDCRHSEWGSPTASVTAAPASSTSASPRT